MTQAHNDESRLFQCTWQVGTVGLKKKTGDKERLASDSVAQLCDSLLTRLKATDPCAGGHDDWCEKIRNSPRIAGVILIGLCQLVRLKYEVFETRVKEIFISLLEGQMKLVVPAAISHAEEFADDDKSVRVRRRRPPGQVAQGEEPTETCEADDDQEQLFIDRKPRARKMPVVDMSWLQRPGMQDQMLEIQDMLNSMSVPSGADGMSSSFEGGMSNSLVSEMMTSSGMEPVEVDEGEGLSFFECNILPSNPPVIPALKLGDDFEVPFNEVQTPNKGDVTMREVVFTERSAIRADTVRRRDSIDIPIEDIRPVKTRMAKVRGVNTREIEKFTKWSDKITTIDLESFAEPDFRKEWLPISLQCRAVTMVPALWVRMVEKLCRPAEERFGEIAHNELRRTILGLARENGSESSGGFLENKLFIEQEIDPSFGLLGQTPSLGHTDSAAPNSHLPSEIETPATIQTPAFPDAPCDIGSSNFSLGTSSDVFGPNANETPAPPFEEFLSSRKGWTSTPLKPVEFDAPTTKLKITVESILNLRKKQNPPDKAARCLFAELVPTTTCTKWQAAITLRHLLTLLAAGQFRARQLQCFGEIEIGFGPAAGLSPATRKRTAEEDSENVCKESNVAVAESRFKGKRRKLESPEVCS